MKYPRYSQTVLQKQRAEYARECSFDNIKNESTERQRLKKVEDRKKIISIMGVVKGTTMIVNGRNLVVAFIESTGIIFFTNWDDLDPFDLLEGNIIKAKVIKKGDKIKCTKRV